jgi:hypothetical protein
MPAESYKSGVFRPRFDVLVGDRFEDLLVQRKRTKAPSIAFYSP